MKWNWHIIGYGFAALVLIGLVTAYEGAQRDKIRSDAVQAAQATYQKQLTSQIADLQKAMADRDAAYQQQLQSLQARLQQAQTPQQIATLVSQVMGLRQPIQISTPLPTPSNPNPAPIAEVSTLDAPQVKAYIQDCETCKLQVPKLQADNSDLKSQLKIKDNAIQSITLQRDTAVKASKGGSFLRRFAKGLKVVACATAGGAAGGASGKGAVPAAIGAGAGAVACSLF